MGFDVKRYLRSVLLGLVIALFVFLLGRSRGEDILRALNDAAFSAAVILLFFGGMGFVGSKGSFDVVGYGISHRLRNHIPALGEPDEDIFAYRERRAEGRGAYRYNLAASLIFFVLAFITLAIYYGRK